MRQQHSPIHDKLLEELDELPDEQLAEVADYVDRLSRQVKQRRSGQGMDAGGLELIWRCTECGYVQERAQQLPDDCPNCGAPKEAFVLVDED
jgi:rubrerythrin